MTFDNTTEPVGSSLSPEDDTVAPAPNSAYSTASEEVLPKNFFSRRTNAHANRRHDAEGTSVPYYYNHTSPHHDTQQQDLTLDDYLAPQDNNALANSSTSLAEIPFVTLVEGLNEKHLRAFRAAATDTIGSVTLLVLTAILTAKAKLGTRARIIDGLANLLPMVLANDYSRQVAVKVARCCAGQLTDHDQFGRVVFVSCNKLLACPKCSFSRTREATARILRFIDERGLHAHFVTFSVGVPVAVLHNQYELERFILDAGADMAQTRHHGARAFAGGYWRKEIAYRARGGRVEARAHVHMVVLSEEADLGILHLPERWRKRFKDVRLSIEAFSAPKLNMRLSVLQFAPSCHVVSVPREQVFGRMLYLLKPQSFVGKPNGDYQVGCAEAMSSPHPDMAENRRRMKLLNEVPREACEYHFLPDYYDPKRGRRYWTRPVPLTADAEEALPDVQEPPMFSAFGNLYGREVA